MYGLTAIHPAGIRVERRMHKFYIRFSKPGGKGFIPGTSTDKYRDDWIDVLAFNLQYRSGQPDNIIDWMGCNLDFDETGLKVRQFNIVGLVIDKVTIETVDKQGKVVFRAIMDQVTVDSVRPNVDGRAILYAVFKAEKSAIEAPSVGPVETKSAGLNPPVGIRRAAFMG